MRSSGGVNSEMGGTPSVLRQVGLTGGKALEHDRKFGWERGKRHSGKKEEHLGTERKDHRPSGVGEGYRGQTTPGVSEGEKRKKKKSMELAGKKSIFRKNGVKL